MTTRFRLNGADVTSEADVSTPLLWVIRDELGLTGTKYSCGIAQCGACLVLMGETPVPSCTTPIEAVEGQRITTIEGLSSANEHPVQRAWAEIDVPQCGYCQSGQIIAASALITSTPDPTDADIDASMSTVLCRCGTYPRIRTAIKRAAELARQG